MNRTYSIGILCAFFLSAGFLVAAVPTTTLVVRKSWNKDDVTLVHSAEGTHQIMVTDGVLPEQETGTPWLPEVTLRVMLPDGVYVDAVDVVFDEIVIADQVRPFPAQPAVPLSESASELVRIVESVYTRQPVWPRSRYSVQSVELMRGYAMLPVLVSPCRWESDAGSLYLATNVTIEITYRSRAVADSPLQTQQQISSSRLFDGLAQQMVLNPADLPTSTDGFDAAYPSAVCDYLVITSVGLSNAFERLAAYHRTNDNVTARVVTTSWIDSVYSGARPSGGSDQQTRIRNCIKDFVENQGTTYVVLGGDNTVVPVRKTKVSCGSHTQNDMPTDLYYSGLDGTWDANTNGVYGEARFDDVDMAYDVIVGRIPVRTDSQTAAYADKVMRYREENIAHAFLNRWILTGEKLWNTYSGSSRPKDVMNDGYSPFQQHDPVSDDEVWSRRMWLNYIQPVKTNLTPHYFFDTLTSWDSATAGNYAQTSANMLTTLNRGYNHLFMGTHGSTASWSLEHGCFGTSAASSLTNLTAWVYTMACNTGGFDLGEPSLSEAFIRNGNGGALAYMGSSRYGWGSPGTYHGGASIEYAQKYYTLALTNSVQTIGSIFAAHKSLFIGSCAYDGAHRWIQFGMNLQGDPLVKLLDTDVVPGSPPFSFSAFALNDAVMLRWPSPILCGSFTDFVRITSATDSYPASPEEGSIIYEGYDTEFVHTGLNSGQSYYYSIWTSNDETIFTAP